jgi:RNA polymerase sigma factor (sigma-70 family)
MRENLQIQKQLQLVDAIKTNDESVLKQLYQDNYKKVEMYIVQNNGSMPQAKDTYQEAFLAVYQNIKAEKFVPTNETALQGYIYQVAKNKWTDYLRSARYRKTTGMIDNYHPAYDASEIDEFNDYEEKDQKLEATIAAFGKLGAECKDLLTRFYFNKKSLRDIASSLNLEETSARNKKYRCMQKLRNIALPPN